MIPRGALDIAWRDLASALVGACVPGDRTAAETEAERVWNDPERTVACLSLRSGFDLFLQMMRWPSGTEVLISAVTIPDMVSVLHHHELVPIPMDVSFDTLTIDERQIESLCTPATRAILIAHLFGSRINLDAIAGIARARGLLLLEDCAQAYDGAYRGHPGADVCMFSFGPIKTATALGGGLMAVKDAALARAMRARQGEYRPQSRMRFLKRVLQAVILKVLGRPSVFGTFARACRWTRVDHDEVVVRLLRGFRGKDLIAQIRRAPSAPLCRLLERRLRGAAVETLDRRRAVAREILSGVKCPVPGSRVANHSHWVIPVESRDPAGLVTALWRGGFDATRRGSSLEAVSPPPDRPWLNPASAVRMLNSLVYLPVYPHQSAGDCRRLSACVNDWEAGVESSPLNRARSARLDKSKC
jgi:perosamine synthetase